MSKLTIDVHNRDNTRYTEARESFLIKSKLKCSKGEVLMPDISRLTPDQIRGAKLEIKGSVESTADVLIFDKAMMINVITEVTFVIALCDVDLTPASTVAQLIADMNLDFSSMSGSYEYTEVALTGISESE